MAGVAKEINTYDIDNIGPGTITVIIPAHNSGRRIGHVISNLSNHLYHET